MNNTVNLSSADGKPWEIFAEELDQLWDNINRLNHELKQQEAERRKLIRELSTVNTLCNILIVWALLATGLLAWLM